jgi:outer membrane protein TolC
LDQVDAALKPLHAVAPAQLASGAERPSQTLEADRLSAELGDRRTALVAAVGRARAELSRWTGETAPEVTGPPPDTDVDADKLRANLDDVPSLRAYDAMGRQADAELASAKADKRSDWSWELAYQHRDPRFGDMVMVQATVSLPFFASTRQDPVIAARAQSASGVRVQREAARRALAAALEGDLADHAMHHDRLRRAEETLAPLAERRASLETASYAAGTASLADVLLTQLALAEARIDRLDREADVVRDAVRINLTYGADAR